MRKTIAKTKDITAGKARAAKIIRLLKKHYPKVKSDLVADNPYEKIVATILSAQCTDARVNMVTPSLFKKYPDASALSRAKTRDVEKIIHSTGFYRNKSRHLVEMAKNIMNEFEGQIPRTMEELTSLPGVARKTANCVLGDCFGKAVGIVVDTHVARLSVRLELTSALKSDAVRIEKDLMRIIPRKEWIDISHRLIRHGRTVCKAQNPGCDTCFFARLCSYSRF